MFDHRFAGVDANPNAQAFGTFSVEGCETTLNVGTSTGGVGNVIEGRHNPITGMLDLASVVRLKAAPNQGVVDSNQF